MERKQLKNWLRFIEKLKGIIAELKGEIPEELLNIKSSEIDEIVEEFVFRKIGVPIAENEVLLNEQINHRNKVLQMFLDFELLGVARGVRNAKIVECAVGGWLKRTAETELCEESNSETENPD